RPIGTRFQQRMRVRLQAEGSSRSLPQMKLRLPGILALTVFLGGALPAAEETSPKAASSALEIFDAAFAKFQADRIALRHWQYHQTLTTEQFDSDGKVTAKGTWHSIVRPGDPRPLEYTGKSVQGQLSFFEPDEKPSPASAASPGKSETRVTTKSSETK